MTVASEELDLTKLLALVAREVFSGGATLINVVTRNPDLTNAEFVYLWTLNNGTARSNGWSVEQRHIENFHWAGMALERSTRQSARARNDNNRSKEVSYGD